MRNVWRENIGDEAAFWRRWFTESSFKAGRDARRADLATSYPPEFAAQHGARPGERLRILDVGWGRISTQRLRAPHNPVELVCVDALADVYNRLLDEFGYAECPRVHAVKGEELSTAYPLDSFHLVNIANALDHCEDPRRTVSEMYSVCRPGGRVTIISIENEGEREQYSGLHQWNLKADDAGLWLWSPATKQNLLEAAPGAEYSWSYQNHGQQGFQIFRVDLRKPAAIDA